MVKESGVKIEVPPPKSQVKAYQNINFEHGGPVRAISHILYSCLHYVDKMSGEHFEMVTGLLTFLNLR